jgi:hypothetical protein
VVVDLVAEPGEPRDADELRHLGAATVRVASPYQVLVSKLCALLGRAELRDLVDVRALLESDLELARAVRDAPELDAGFSPLSLAWVLRSLPVAPLGHRLGWSDTAIDDLTAYRDELIDQLLALARPDVPS